MRKKRAYLVLCPVLFVLWVFPVLYGGFSWDDGFIRPASSYLLFIAAALLSRLPKSLHAALISASAVGAASCALYPAAVFDILPTLLLCLWLRCWEEHEKGNGGRVYFEVVTDLIYASLIAAVVRLIRSGYSFLKIQPADEQTLPELLLMAFVLLFFVFLFAVGAGNRASANLRSAAVSSGTSLPENRNSSIRPLRPRKSSVPVQLVAPRAHSTWSSATRVSPSNTSIRIFGAPFSTGTAM